MVRVDVVWVGPAQLLHCRRGGGSDAGRLRMHDQVFTVGFVPDRDDLQAVLGGLETGAQLRFGLVGKPVAYSKGVFCDS